MAVTENPEVLSSGFSMVAGSTGFYQATITTAPALEKIDYEFRKHHSNTFKLAH